MITKDIQVYFELLLGYCLYLKGKGPYIGSYSCRHFIQGCHRSSYKSIKIYERKSCNSLMLHPLLKSKCINRKGIPLNDDVCFNNSKVTSGYLYVKYNCKLNILNCI